MKEQLELVLSYLMIMGRHYEEEYQNEVVGKQDVEEGKQDVEEGKQDVEMKEL